jgi:hypothetical protein
LKRVDPTVHLYTACIGPEAPCAKSNYQLKLDSKSSNHIEKIVARLRIRNRPIRNRIGAAQTGLHLIAEVVLGVSAPHLDGISAKNKLLHTEGFTWSMIRAHEVAVVAYRKNPRSPMTSHMGSSRFFHRILAPTVLVGRRGNSNDAFFVGKVARPRDLLAPWCGLPGSSAWLERLSITGKVRQQKAVDSIPTLATQQGQVDCQVTHTPTAAHPYVTIDRSLRAVRLHTPGAICRACAGSRDSLVSQRTRALS